MFSFDEIDDDDDYWQCLVHELRQTALRLRQCTADDTELRLLNHHELWFDGQQQHTDCNDTDGTQKRYDEEADEDAPGRQEDTTNHLIQLALSYALELEPVQEALDEVFRSLREQEQLNPNCCVKSVVLQGLPEPDMAKALLQLSKLSTLQSLSIEEFMNQPISLRQSNLLKCLESNVELQRVSSNVCFHVFKQEQVEGLARVLGRLTELQQLSLRITLRCTSPARCADEFALDSLLLSLANLPNLQTVDVRLGYQYNPYGSPLCSVESLQSFLRASTTTLTSLTLQNLGLQDGHLAAIGECMTSSSLALEDLNLDRNCSLTAAGVRDTLLQALSCWPPQNETIKHLSVRPTSPAFTYGNMWQSTTKLRDVQRELDMHCLLNAVRRGAILRKLYGNDAFAEDAVMQFQRILTELAPSTAEQRSMDADGVAQQSIDFQTSLSATYWMLRHFFPCLQR